MNREEEARNDPTPRASTEPSSRLGKALWLCLGATALLTALDIGTKEWAVTSLSHERPEALSPACEPDEHGRIFMQRMRAEPLVLIDGYFELRYAENCGAAFGLMREAPAIARRVVFGFAASLASVALFWMFVRNRGGRLFAISVPFIVSGALGNLSDRIRYGYVVDFIRVHVQDRWEWPTFNIADAAITVGVVLLLIDGMREGKREERAKEETDSSATDEARV